MSVYKNTAQNASTNNTGDGAKKSRLGIWKMTSTTSNAPTVISSLKRTRVVIISHADAGTNSATNAEGYGKGLNTCVSAQKDFKSSDIFCFLFQTFFSHCSKATWLRG